MLPSKGSICVMTWLRPFAHKQFGFKSQKYVQSVTDFWGPRNPWFYVFSCMKKDLAKI